MQMRRYALFVQRGYRKRLGKPGMLRISSMFSRVLLSWCYPGASRTAIISTEALEKSGIRCISLLSSGRGAVDLDVTSAMVRFRLLSPSGALSIIYRAVAAGAVSPEKRTRTRHMELQRCHSRNNAPHNSRDGQQPINPIGLCTVRRNFRSGF
jgi:hypothetical protein